MMCTANPGVIARSARVLSFTLVLLAARLLLPGAAAFAQTEAPNISAPQAILLDYESGSVLFERGADIQSAPASLAKLMTMAVVFREIKEGRITPDTEYTVSEYAWRRGGAPSGGSTMFAALKSSIKVSDLMRGVIIQSGNDAAIVLAEGLAGNELAFSTRMNEEAKRIGMTNSVFRNSNGLPAPDQVTTARDMAKLAAYIIRNYPQFYAIYGETSFTWNKIRQNNRNPLLGMSLGADGLKTGYLEDAGYNLVGSAVQNDQRLIVVIMGDKTAKDRAEDARKLLEWGFRSFETRLLFKPGQIVGEATLYGGARGGAPLTGTGPIRIVVPRDGNERVTARIRFQGPIPAPVTEGDEVARLDVYRGDQLALQVPLVAAESVPRGPLWRRAMDGAYELMVNLIRQGYAKLTS
ncbi:D-alanyl-D-alanine carboxypeptidase family protein [Ancylobacter mangrovi]|uniref:D-alanyl-D-alanine carboxypeptidase family protein n=1 Tax=Ancylobacter mangrovi TaxID=2972472 RepID=UPI002161B925|nr:D-alanyl-D-alanine carboxypeptidase family protein [Ancylobacter mangrovi]MCS0503587.1 D-alanyl-D-alanine carboxypeptidase [Ancylobacter mangrovi]